MKRSSAMLTAAAVLATLGIVVLAPRLSIDAEGGKTMIRWKSAPAPNSPSPEAAPPQAPHPAATPAAQPPSSSVGTVPSEAVSSPAPAESAASRTPDLPPESQNGGASVAPPPPQPEAIGKAAVVGEVLMTIEVTQPADTPDLFSIIRRMGYVDTFVARQSPQELVAGLSRAQRVAAVGPAHVDDPEMTAALVRIARDIRLHLFRFEHGVSIWAISPHLNHGGEIMCEVYRDRFFDFLQHQPELGTALAHAAVWRGFPRHSAQPSPASRQDSPSGTARGSAAASAASGGANRIAYAFDRGLPPSCRLYPRNYGRGDFANGRMNAYSTDATFALSVPCPAIDAVREIHCHYRANVDGGSAIGGESSFVVICGGREIVLGHGYGNRSRDGEMDARIEVAGAVQAIRRMRRRSAAWIYDVVLTDGAISFAGRTADGEPPDAFRLTASVPSFTVSSVTSFRPQLYVTTNMHLWLDSLTVEYNGAPRRASTRLPATSP